MPVSSGSAKRIDLQVTLDFSSELLSFGDSCLRSSTQTTRRQRQSGTLIGRSTRTDGLFCGSVGKRTGPRYFRVYDKGVESKSAAQGRKWRLELETKYNLAEDLCNEHLCHLKEPRFCASYCIASWKSLGLSWPVTAFADDLKPVAIRNNEPSPAAKLLLWYGTTVKPTMPRVLSVFSVAEVLQMLGLEDVAIPTPKHHAHSEPKTNDRARGPNLSSHSALQPRN